MSKPSVEHEIVEYLRLEFGEDDSEEGSIQVEDLAFQGEFEIEGIVRRCWSFASYNDSQWVSAHEVDGGLCFDLVDNPGFSPEVTYDYVWIQVWDSKGSIEKVPLVRSGHTLAYFDDDFEIEFKSGRQVSIYVEIGLNTSPKTFSVYVTENETKVAVHSDEKGIVDFVISETEGVKIAIGGEKWF